MSDCTREDDFFSVVIRMAVLYRLQEREFGASEPREEVHIFSKVRSLALRERGLTERSKFENEPDATCRSLLDDESGFVEMLVNRTLAGRGVITSADVREVRRILNAPGGPA